MQVLKYVFVGLVCWGCADAGDAPVTPDDGADVMIGDATDAGPDEDTNSPADTGEGEDTATPGGECEGKPDGTPCEDGDICSVDDVCTNGQCGGEPRDCNDGDPCTTGTCDAEAGCVYAPAEDGTPCVANCFAVASCLTGACTPNTDTAIVCPQPVDGDSCIASFECDPANGQCTSVTYKDDGETCDTDEDLCTLESCQSGECTDSGSVNECETENQNNPCWTYVCNKKDGICKNTVFVEGVSCTDNNPCTTSDVCDDATKTCVGEPLPVDDGNPCTNDYCDEGTVFHDTTVGAACDTDVACAPIGICDEAAVCVAQDCECVEDEECDGGAGQCSIGTCDGGQCAVEPLAVGTLCDDGKPGTTNDACDGNGTCVGTTPPDTDELFVETFDDGDYTQAPSGALTEACNPGSCGTMTAEVLTPAGATSPVLAVTRVDAPADSGALIVRYNELQALVPGSATAVLLKYRVRILNDQLDWGGGGCTEWTARVGVKVNLLDSTTRSLNSIHNTGTKNCTATGDKVWVYQQLNLNEWTDVEVNITSELSTAGITSAISTVNFIEVGSNGWNFEAQFDDIRIEYAE